MTTQPPGEDPTPEFPPGYDEVKVPIEDPTDDAPVNVDDDGTAHYCVIPPRGDDYCGGCGNPWPCDKARHLLVLPMPVVE